MKKLIVSHFSKLSFFLQNTTAFEVSSGQYYTKVFAKKTGKHNHANRNTFISKPTVNFIINIVSNLIKKEISNSVRKAGIYSVQIDSTQDITSTDKRSVILRFVRESV